MPKVFNLQTVTSMNNNDYLLMEGSSGGTKKITRQNMFGGATGTLNVLQNYYVYPEITLGASASTSVTLNLRQSSNYHSAIIIGAVGGVGGVVLGCIINNGQVTVKNLMTGENWTSQNLQITASGNSMTISSSYQYASYITVLAG